MTILQISDTHNQHRLLTDLPTADILVHCGDFTDMGTEEEVLNFLNWFIEQPYRHKIFVTGNHDLCLWKAENIEDLPNNIHFLQGRGCEIEGVRFFVGIQVMKQVIISNLGKVGKLVVVDIHGKAFLYLLLDIVV